MSSDSGEIENTSTTKDLCLSSSCLSNKDGSDGERIIVNDRKEVAVKLPYPVVSDHRDPSSVLTLLQKETQATSKKILDVIKQIENCEKHLTSNVVSEKNKNSLKYERVKLKQQLDALKKHERRISLQIDFVTTKIEIKGLEDKRKQVAHEDNTDENEQITVLLGKLKQQLDKMKVYMRTRNEQMKKISNNKQQSSTSNDTRKPLSTSQKPRTSSDLNSKRPLSSSASVTHSNKRLKPTTHNHGKPPIVRLASRSNHHQSQSHAVRPPTVRFVNKTTGSAMTALNSSSPTTPASSSSTLSSPVTTNGAHMNHIDNSLQQMEIPPIDEDDELDLELNIDELFNEESYSEENLQEFKSETRQVKINHEISKKES